MNYNIDRTLIQEEQIVSAQAGDFEIQAQTRNLPNV